MKHFGIQWLRAGLVGLGALFAVEASANLFVNPGFEEVPGPGLGQGLLPSSWFQVGSSADTYSNDGSFGLSPGEFGNFPGVQAHGGLRWVAGANINQPAAGEAFGQLLAAPLQSGTEYSVSAWLHQALRFDLNNPGGYDLWLDKGDFSSRLLVGHLGDTSSPTVGWQSFTTTFLAPVNANEYTRFVFGPLAAGSFGAYPGIDDVDLSAVPEPSTAMAITVLLVGLAALKKRR